MGGLVDWAHQVQCNRVLRTALHHFHEAEALIVAGKPDQELFHLVIGSRLLEREIFQLRGTLKLRSHLIR